MAVDLRLLQVPIIIIKDTAGYFFNGGSVPTRGELLKCKELVDACLSYSDDEVEKWNSECEEYHCNQAKIQSGQIKSKDKQTLSGYIYVYKQGKYCKIGRSKTNDCREKKYVTENPNEIDLVYRVRVDDYIGEEKRLHSMFSDKIHNREWFKLTKEDIRKIKRLYATYF